MTKTCVACNAIKDASAFHRNGESPDGLLSICKDCAKERRAAKRVARDKDGRTCRDDHCEQVNPQPLDQFTVQGWICQSCRIRNQKAANINYQLQNPEKNAANTKAWREECKAAGLPVRSDESKARDNERARERYAKDLAYREAKLTKQKAYWEQNKEKCLEKHSGWQRSSEGKKWHKEYTRKQRENKTTQHERQLESQTVWRNRNWHKDASSKGWVRTVESQSISSTYLRRLLAWQNGRCYICNIAFDNGVHKRTLEHIIPRSRGGPSIEQNCVLTCQRCNYSRQAKYWAVEWEPDVVAPYDAAMFVKWKTIHRSLHDAGLSPEATPDGFKISGPKGERHLYIVSTFTASERNPQAGRVIQCALDTDPSRIVILDYEWYRRQTAVLNMLKSKVGTAISDYSARKLKVIEIDQATANKFLTDHHVMGSTIAPYRVALSDGDRIYGLGMFVDHDTHYDCVRLAFHGHVPGGMSRIIKHFFRLHGEKPLMSFVDARYASGEGHSSIGFKTVDPSRETYVWVLPDRVQHQRYFSNDNKMSRNLLYFDPDQPKDTVMRANGIFKLWMPKKHKMWLE